MEDLKNIIKEIAGWRHIDMPDLTDDMILDCATRIFISQNIEKSQDKREYYKKPYTNRSINPRSANEPITPKQKQYLINNGYEGDVSILTKAEAHVLISKYKKDNEGAI